MRDDARKCDKALSSCAQIIDTISNCPENSVLKTMAYSLIFKFACLGPTRERVAGRRSTGMRLCAGL